MVDALQYTSDLRDPDLLRTTIEDYLSVCVIPIKTDRQAAIMASVKIKVLLPLNREVFALGTVIMHRPDGFLVQLDCSPDLNFLRSTLAETVTSEVIGHAAIRPARPESIAPRPETTEVHSSSAESSPNAPAPLIEPAPLDDDYTVFSISAVDKDTGLPRGTGSQPVIQPERTKRERPAASSSHSPLDDEFGAPRKAGSTDGSAPVDELFSLAAEAGAIDLAYSGLLGLHKRTEPESRTSENEDGTVRTGNEPTRPAYRRPEQVTQAPVAGPASSDNEPAGESAPQIEPENRELAVRIREMSTIEKQKLARQGKRVARRILIRDNDKTVHKFIFFNPDVQLDEVIEYTRWASLAPDAIEFIASSRAWMESRDVLFNLVKNPSTPIELAVRYVIKLSPGEWRMLARPGVVRPPIMNQARKLLFEAEKKS